MICKNCGKELLPLAVYCTECGTKVRTKLDFSYQEEDERDFVFHKEYYGFRYGTTGHSYAWFDGTLYRIFKKDKGNYCSDTYLLKIQNQKVVDSFYFGEQRVALLGANRYGLFLQLSDEKIALYDFQGYKQSEFSIREIFGENYDMSMNASYIFKSKIYFSMYRKREGASLKEIGMCVKAYDFCRRQLEDVWSLQQMAEPIEAFLKEQLRGMLIEYGDKEKYAENLEFSMSCDERYLFANSQYMVLPCDILAAPKEISGYQAEYNMIFLIDFASSICVNLKGFKSHGKRAVRFDLKNNKMWIETESDFKTKIWKKFPISIFEEAEKEEDVWRFDLDKLRHANWDGESYFDGTRFYATGLYYFFYSYAKNGEVDEWNRSGHGSVHAVVYGPYVYPCLDMREDIELYPHGIKMPTEGCYSLDTEEAIAVIEEKRRKEEQKMEIPIEDHEQPEDVPLSVKYEKSENQSLPKQYEEEKSEVVSGTHEEVENVFETTSVLEFREFLQKSSDYAEIFKEYRKGLKNRKWDFNVVMGILIGSCKRHAVGARHIQEQNAGIGQGDNGDNVVKGLEKYGLMDIYKKYETISDTELRMMKVISEISTIAPQLLDICDAIKDILEQD